NENLSDMVGGSENGYNNGESDPITLNMLQTETINRSSAFGAVVLKKIGQVNHLKYPKVQRAPFMVLKFPDITSVLVETAFISNPKEERMLRRPSYQTDIAWAIAYAVDKFIPLPSEADRDWCKEVTTAASAGKKSYVTYKVRKGDVLEQIAYRHGTTVRALMKINKLKSKNRIYTGQKLKLVAEPSKSVPSVYVVKWGDNLENIAVRHSTTVSALMKINKLKSKNRIYTGQKLKLVAEPSKSVPSVYVVK
ncbi:MAG: LysM peptidoglycan-binding domain-containing protein, partial [Thermodesulfobacteriota bacterium]|nr:LysM peptidoglycan-binding domain-containing protein [Thermodesulfobacteriota bacterium]